MAALDITRARCDVRARAQGYGIGDLSFDGFAPGRYWVSAARDGNLISELEAEADASGRLAFAVDASAIEPLELRIACLSGKSSTTGNR